jgi:2-polyprenyl-3-methyl-5-hydroxy-6-metoxy-1,4-benzoquinol methylase
MSGVDEKLSYGSGCPCCGENSFTLWMRVSERSHNHRDFELLRCSTCSHIWLGNPPTPEQLSFYYSTEYHQALQQSGDHDTKRWGRQQRVLSRYKTEGSILDIGCSAGGFLAHIKDGPWRLYGIEASVETAEKARRATGGNIFAGDVMKANFAPRSFDVITCSDVLEHLYEPHAVFQKVYEWLKPGGIFYVFVPNINSWEARAFGSHWYGLDLPRHLHHYSIASLKALSKSANIPLVRVVTPAGCYLEQSTSLLLNDLLASANATHSNVNLSGPAWIGWRVLRKAIRLSVLETYARVASYSGAAPSLQAIFQKAPQSADHSTEELLSSGPLRGSVYSAREGEEIAQ